MKKGTQKNNVEENAITVLEPEVEEIPLEQVIDTTLVKHNITETVIATLKEKYSGMQLKSLDDKEGYLDIKEARKEVRKVGILTEKICKHGREDAIKTQKLWLNKEKEILSKIAEVENPLNDEIEKFENEVERKEKEERNKQEERYIKRQSALSKMGAVYDNGSFVLNHISYEIDLIKQSDDDVWEEMILPKYRKEFEAIEAVRVAEENKRKEEQEELRRQQEELYKQENDLKEAMAKMQREKDELERQQRLSNERAEKEKRDKETEILNSRLKQLDSIYWNGASASYRYNDEIIVKQDELLAMDDEQFEVFRNSHNDKVKSHKEEVEKQRLAKAEQEKLEAVRQALEDEEKRKQEAQAKRLQELDMASDKVKYEDVVKYLKATPVHLMKSPTYKSRMNAINIFISEL